MLDLTSKTSREKANAKAAFIADVFKPIKKNLNGELRVEVVELNKIDGGVELFARAWRHGKQIGFGDGTIDLERFRFFNPPILIPDDNGSIVQTWTRADGKEITRKLTEDPTQAVLDQLLHTVAVSGAQISDRIVAGRRGSTVSTFYPTTDGWVAARNQTTTWATLRAANGTNVDSAGTDTSTLFAADPTSNTWDDIFRALFIFDTSSIPDADTISAATFSLYGETKQDSNSNTPSTNIYPGTTASDTALAAADFQSNTSSTAWCDTPVTYAGFSTTGYNDFALNATGIAGIDKVTANKTKIAWKDKKYDVDGATPTWGSGSPQTGQFAYTVDQTGTSQDPKLVVVHSGGEVVPVVVVDDFLLLGV